VQCLLDGPFPIVCYLSKWLVGILLYSLIKPKIKVVFHHHSSQVAAGTSPKWMAKQT